MPELKGLKAGRSVQVLPPKLFAPDTLSWKASIASSDQLPAASYGDIVGKKKLFRGGLTRDGGTRANISAASCKES